MNTFIRNTKIYFGIIVTSLIILFVSIGSFIQKHEFFNVDDITHEVKTIGYKSDYVGGVTNFITNFSDAVNTKVTYQKGTAPSIPILVYHGIPNESDNSLINITAEDFKKHIFALKKAGYTTIDTHQLYQYLKGEIKLPEKSIMITFDDGRIDSYTIADPILDAMNYKAVMFAIGRYPLLGERKTYYLSLEQLQKMNSSGRWDVEAHSYDGHNTYFTSPLEQNGHFFSHKIWLTDKNRLETDQEFNSRVFNDLTLVKTDLGKNLKKTIESFAFPYGDYGQNSTNFMGAENITIKDTGSLYNLGFYQIAPETHFTSNYFVPEKKNNSFFLVRRININPKWTGEDLLNTLDKSSAKTLPYSDDFSVDRGWIRIWGNLTLNKNSLNLKAAPEETGGSIVLDGSRLWKDYTVTATVRSDQQSGVYVWVRYADDNNNASCDFGKNFIHIEQTVNGKKSIIQGTNFKNTILTANTNYFIKVQVKDRTISCTLNDTLLVTTPFMDTSLVSGGLGFKTWETTPGQSSLTLQRIDVKGL